MANTVRPTTSIDQLLPSAAERGDVPAAAGEDGVIYETAPSVRSAQADDPITPDTTLRIASMAKMVTTVAALQLAEGGGVERALYASR